jgi:hypothetical protein
VLGVGQETKGRGVTANVIQVRSIDEEHRRAAGSSAATPEEIVAAMLYLCSDEAAPVTSSRLALTGD